MGSVGPGSIQEEGTVMGVWEQGMPLSTVSEGQSLVHVLQQQVHGLRKVVHVPICLHFWVLLVSRPGRQDHRLV